MIAGLLVLFAAATAKPVRGQWLERYARETLDINNVHATVDADGTLFSRLPKHRPGFETPAGSGLHTLFASTLWIGGQSANLELYQAAQFYRQNGRIDFFPGPVRLDGTSAAPPSQWNRVYKVNQATVRSHRQSYDSPGYTVPPAIRQWPANGPEGYASVLAPYFDQSGDGGGYQPEKGDYPFFPGDQVCYFIYNDQYAAHTESGGQKMGIEVHGMMYGYDRPSNEALHNTVFVEYRIINRSSRNYQDVMVGQFIDFEIGYYLDDYIGVDTLLQTVYGYNSDAFDESTDTIAGYGNRPPAQAAVLLNHELSYALHLENTASSPRGRPDPGEAIQYYRLLEGRYKYNTTVPGGFSYPGDVCHLDTPGTQLSTIPSDQRMIASTGPFDLPSGGVLTVKWAFVAGPRPPAGEPEEAVCLLLDRVAALRKQQLVDAQPTKRPATRARLSIAPNPVQQGREVRVTAPPEWRGSVAVRILTATGRPAWQRQYRLLGGDRRIGLPTHQLPPGCYQVRLEGAGQSVSAPLLVR
jgi:hypothetical protein